MTYLKNTPLYLQSQLKYLILSLILLSSSICRGQDINTNVGESFWFGFIGNHDGYPQPQAGNPPTYTYIVTYAVNITSFYSTTGTLTIPLQGYSVPFTVTPGSVTRLTIPHADVFFDEEGISNTAVNIVAAKPIEVFYDEESPGPRNDNSYVLPDTLLGNKYYVSAYNAISDLNDTTQSQFIIATAGNKVSVAITPSVNTSGGHLAGVTYTMTITRGQVYQVRSTGTQDLTGTKIVATDTNDPTQKFSVSAGMDIGSVGCSGTVDPAFEELIPVVYWGKSYIFIPTPDSAQDICRIMASANGTQVTTNGGTPTTLNAGQYFDQLINYTAPAYISATKPISVERLLQTASCNGIGNSLGDPDMILVQPNEQMYLDSITFYANNINGIDSNWIQVVTRTSNVNNILLDGTSIGAYFKPLAQGSTPNEYSYASVDITANSTTGVYHQLTTNSSCEGFLAYIEGIGSPTSTGSAAGVFLHFPTGGVASAKPTATSCSLCNGTATVYLAGGFAPFTYSWSDANAQKIQTATGLCPGVYTVVIQEGCNFKNDTATVTVPAGPPMPVANFNPTPDTIDAGGVINFLNLSKGATSYVWTLGDGTKLTDTVISHSYSETGIFVVTLVAKNSLCSDTIEKDIYVNLPIKVPNIFTPNGDNINDEFVVQAGGTKSYDIQIFDRWGKKVFESQSPAISWTGKDASGVMESDGIYYYILKASDYAGKNYNLKGYIQLVR